MASQDKHTRGERNFVAPSRPTVLIVHDDLTDLHYYSDILQMLGFLVQMCRSYEEGVRLLGSGFFDLIIVSQGTFNFEGQCVVECAKQIDRNLPVLVVANCLYMPCYLEAMQLGAEDYLVAPVSMRELERVVRTHVRPRGPVHQPILKQGINPREDRAGGIRHTSQV